MNPEMGPRTETSDDVAIGTLEHIADLRRLQDEAEREGKTGIAALYRQMIEALLKLIGR